MYLLQFLVNFAVFCEWISRDFADFLEIHGSMTAQNIRSPVLTNGDNFAQKQREPASTLRLAGIDEHFQMWSLTLVLPVGNYPSLLDRSISNHYSKEGTRGKQGVHMPDHSQFFQVHPAQMAILHFWCLCWRWRRNTSLWEGWHLEYWASCNPHNRHC